jgi:hypothetical protein
MAIIRDERFSMDWERFSWIMVWDYSTGPGKSPRFGIRKENITAETQRALR